MSLQSLLNQSVDVYRLSVTTGSKKQHSKVASIPVMIAPMSANAASIANMAISRAFTGYTLPSSNVQIGDYLRDFSGNKYDVQGARNYTMGSQPLVELSLQQQVKQGQI